MRKLVLGIILGVAVMSVNAQETFKKGTKLLEVAIGFNSNGTPIAVSYEVGVKDNLFDVNKLNLGIGGFMGFYGYSSTKFQFGGSSTTNFALLSPGVRALVHYQLINKLEAYAGPSIGFSLQRATTEASGMEAISENKVLFAWGFIGGLRYEITPKWGAFIETGKATGNLTLGAAYKF